MGEVKTSPTSFKIFDLSVIQVLILSLEYALFTF
jgi:hypothetical protein